MVINNLCFTCKTTQHNKSLASFHKENKTRASNTILIKKLSKISSNNMFENILCKKITNIDTASSIQPKLTKPTNYADIA